MKKDPNFEEQLIFCLKNDIRNLGNFNPSSGKPENLMGYFCRKYVKIQRSCVVKNYFAPFCNILAKT